MLDTRNSSSIVACFEVTEGRTSARCSNLEVACNGIIAEFNEQSFASRSVAREEHSRNVLGCNFVEDHCSVCNVGDHEDGVTACVSDLCHFRSNACCGFCVSNLCANVASPCIFDCISKSGPIVVGHVKNSRVGCSRVNHHCSSSRPLDSIARNNTEEVRVSGSVTQTWVGRSVRNHRDSCSRQHCVGSHGSTGACCSSHGDNVCVNQRLCGCGTNGTIATRIGDNRFKNGVGLCSIQVNNGLKSTVFKTSCILGQWSSCRVQESDLYDGSS